MQFRFIDGTLTSKHFAISYSFPGWRVLHFLPLLCILSFVHFIKGKVYKCFCCKIKSLLLVLFPYGFLSGIAFRPRKKMALKKQIPPLKWFHSFLSDKFQKVLLDDCSSTPWPWVTLWDQGCCPCCLSSVKPLHKVIGICAEFPSEHRWESISYYYHIPCGQLMPWTGVWGQ